MDLSHLRAIRDWELDRVRPLMPAGSRVLEIGSGAGWQAKRLTSFGFDVVAIDVPASNYATVRVYPTILYDGAHLPFPDASFDVVFSSNVLEHVASLAPLLDETRRVLTPGGVVIHVLPTPSWRMWTAMTHYVYLARHRRNYGRRGFVRALWQRKHGERGNLFTEMYYFSGYFWRRIFREHGWTVIQYFPNRLFYTGYSIFDAQMGITQRVRAASYLGSACGIFVLADGADTRHRN